MVKLGKSGGQDQPPSPFVKHDDDKLRGPMRLLRTHTNLFISLTVSFNFFAFLLFDQECKDLRLCTLP